MRGERNARELVCRVSLCVLGCALVVSWAATAASAKGIIPAKTPYAAEIRVTIAYDGTYTSDSEVEQDCTDVNGNTIMQSTGAHEVEHIDRTVVFRHVTVPVVPPSALGKAAGRLALKPQVTDPGQIESDKSAYDVSGTDVTDNNPCPQTISNFTCHGNVFNYAALVSGLVTADDGFEPEVFQLPVRSAQLGEPLGCSGTGDNDVVSQLDIAADNADLGAWGLVVLHSLLKPRFYELRTKTHEEFTQQIGPGQPCQPIGFPELSCSQSVTGSAHITIKRLLLHRTKRSYPK